MAITTQAGIIAASPGQSNPAIRPNGTPNPQGQWMASMWLAPSSVTQGVAPSSGLSGDVPTDATAGSAITFTNPSSGNTYLGRMVIASSSSTPVWITVYDRLWHNSGTDLTITTPQTVNSVALTRPNSTGDWVEAWWQNYSPTGAGTPTVTLSYTNSAGTASRTATSQVFSAVMSTGNTGQFMLAAGDTGVQSVQTWTGSATFSSGTMGIVLRRRVTDFLVRHNREIIGDAISMGLPRIYDDACLEFLYRQVSSATYPVVVTTSLIQG